MSEHKVEVLRVEIEEHPNADALELARIGDFRSIVRKGQFHSGDLVAYIPEQSILPSSLIEEMGLVGKLAGKNSDRVKPVRLRGVLSQGLCYPARSTWTLGQDVALELGITKYVPPIPAHLSGEVYALGQDKCLKYDIENWKRFPHLIAEGEAVVLTEKVHGTNVQMGFLPPSMAHPEFGPFYVSSKGMASQGLALSQNERNAKNLYVRVAQAWEVESKLRQLWQTLGEPNAPIYVVGEIFGQGVQDLAYGRSTAQDNTLGFRVFDIFVGRPGAPESKYADDSELDSYLRQLDLPRVPVLYRGPFSREILSLHTNGPETLSGKTLHVREGVVLRPLQERRSDEIGRVQLKSVSEAYLMRKGETTEYN